MINWVLSITFDVISFSEKNALLPEVPVMDLVLQALVFAVFVSIKLF